MKKVFVFFLLLTFCIFTVSSCAKMVYKTEGDKENMYIQSNMGKCFAVWDSVWELSYRNRVNVGSLDNGEYLLYKDINDSASSVYQVEKFDSKSPYPKFFANQKYFTPGFFPEFKLEYIYGIRFLKVSSFEDYLKINKTKKTGVSHIDEYTTEEYIKKLYDAVVGGKDQSSVYSGYENYPKLGFLDWDNSKCEYLTLLTDLIKINDSYFIIMRNGYEDQPKKLIQIDSDVAEYLLNNVVEDSLSG